MDWKNKPSQIFNKVKQQMYSKGIQNFYFVDHFINDFDPNHTGILSEHAFNLFTNKIGVFLTTQEIRNVKDIYGKNGGIEYFAFLQDVKYSFTENVNSLINEAFQKLDTEHTGNVLLSDVISKFNASQHPHALSRRKSIEQIKNQFVNGITRKAVDNRVSKQEFVDFYAEMNFCVPLEHEDYMLNLLRGTWGLVDARYYVSPSRLREIELTLFQKVREKSNGRSGQWKQAKKAMFYFDLGDQKACDLQNFARALDKFGCNFKKHQIKALFDKYDTDQSGRLDYEEFSKMIMALDINGMESKPNLLKTLGTNYFKVTH